MAVVDEPDHTDGYKALLVESCLDRRYPKEDRVCYDVIIADVDDSGVITDSRTLASVYTGVIQDKDAELLRQGITDPQERALKERLYLPEGFMELEQIAHQALGDMPEVEFTKLYISHTQLEQKIAEGAITLQHGENEVDTLLSAAVCSQGKAENSQDEQPPALPNRDVTLDSFSLGAKTLMQGSYHRVWKSLNYDSFKTFGFFPAFDVEVREKQAKGLSRYPVNDLIESLPNMLSFVINSNANAKTVLLTNYLFEDSYRLIDIYAQAASKKLTQNILQADEEAALTRFVNHLEQAQSRLQELLWGNKPTETLSNHDEKDEGKKVEARQEFLSRLLMDQNRYIGYVLEGVDPKCPYAIFYPDIDTPINPAILQADFDKVIVLFNEISQEIRNHQNNAFYTEAYSQAQHLHREIACGELGLGIESIDYHTGQMTFTKDHFLLSTPMLVESVTWFDAKEIAQVLAYNLLEVYDHYRRHPASEKTEGNVLFLPDMQMPGGEAIDRFLTRLKGHVDHVIIPHRDDLNAEDLWQQAYDMAVRQQVYQETFDGKPLTLTKQIINEKSRRDFFDQTFALAGIERSGDAPQREVG